MATKDKEHHAKPKERVSLRDAVLPATVIVLASVESGSQGGVPVFDELTSYVVDSYDVNGFGGAVEQLSVGIDDLVTGAISLQGAAIIGGGLLLRHYLKTHGKRHVVTKTAHHTFAIGG